MIGQSQSGTGKTAAFALTMLSRVNMDLKKPQVSRVALSTPASSLTLIAGHLYRSLARISATDPLGRAKDGSLHSRRMFPRRTGFCDQGNALPDAAGRRRNAWYHH